MSTPSGPAGGDLSGTYPDPTVPGLVTNAAAIAAIDTRVTFLEGQVVGIFGALSGLNVEIAAINAALALLDVLQSGTGALDGGGQLNVTTNPPANVLVACGASPSMSGSIITEIGGSGNFTIQSTATGSDSGKGVNWIAF